YISSPILFHCLAYAAHIRDMHFMLQQEVVERMAAAPGGKDYGRLSVMLQLACTVEPLLQVPARVPAATQGRIRGGAADPAG
ncbi:Ribosomal RNA adenine methylase transferase, partial [mine drainage metagenome]